MKTQICLFLVTMSLLITHNAFAQAPAIEWQNVIGGNQREELAAAMQTPDGGYILGGSSISGISYNKTEANVGASGKEDYWIVKLNSAGSIEWQNTIGGNDEDVLTSLDCTADGGYIIGGYSYSEISGDKTMGIYGPDNEDPDYWILKLDMLGNIEWQRAYGGKRTDRLFSLEQTSDGGYILGGNSNSFSNEIKSEDPIGDLFFTDYWVIKTDANGDIEWENTIGGDTDENLTCIHQTMEGGYILIGDSGSGISGDKSEYSSSFKDYWIVKLSPLGTIEWENTIGGPSIEYSGAIIQTSEGGYLFAGESNSDIGGDKTENSNLMDYWIVKLNAAGLIEWQNTIGGFENDIPNDVIETADGYVVCGRSMSGISFDKTEPQVGLDDYWIVKIDFAGNIAWQKTIGGVLSDMPFIILQSDDGGYLVGGTSDSPVSGDKTEPRHGTFSDFWIVKIASDVCVLPSGLFENNITPSKATLHWDAIAGADTYQVWYRTTGAGTWIKKSSATNSKTIKSLSPGTNYEYKVRTKCSDGEFSDFSSLENFTTLPLKNADTENEFAVIYPNPASDLLYIDLSYQPDRIKMLNAAGMEIKSIPISNSGLTEIDISGLPDGIYFLIISGSSITKVEKFIKQ